MRFTGWQFSSDLYDRRIFFAIRFALIRNLMMNRTLPDVNVEHNEKNENFYGRGGFKALREIVKFIACVRWIVNFDLIHRQPWNSPSWLITICFYGSSSRAAQISHCNWNDSMLVIESFSLYLSLPSDRSFTIDDEADKETMIVYWLIITESNKGLISDKKLVVRSNFPLPAVGSFYQARKSRKLRVMWMNYWRFVLALSEHTFNRINFRLKASSIIEVSVHETFALLNALLTPPLSSRAVE